MRIGELAARTGLSIDRIRVWERRYRLVQPVRSAGGFRLYSEEDLQTLLAMRDLVESGAAAVGAGPVRIYLRHLLPNLLPQVAVLAVVRYSHVILGIGTLSFLGVGIQPPRPEWGAMLHDSMPYFYRAPHLLLAPFGATLFVCLALAAAGERLRRTLDPKLR
jgi:peptide/nickel transport system permease protein